MCVSFYEYLRGLVKKGWLELKDSKAQVKEYDTTPQGKRILAEGYRTADIKDFVITIEPTGFVLNILEIIDARLSNDAKS